MKTKVTKKEYLQIVGLLALSEKHSKIINDIEEELRDIVGETEVWGHCGDAIWDDNLRNADSLLEKLKIKRAQKGSPTKRDIACEKCSLKYHDYPADIEGPAESVKKKKGIALKDYCCDRCGENIPKGTKCVAISVIVQGHGQQYYEWEKDFIKEAP